MVVILPLAFDDDVDDGAGGGPWQAAVDGRVKDALSYVQMMQKLCNHPKVLEMNHNGKGVTLEEMQYGSRALKLFIVSFVF